MEGRKFKVYSTELNRVMLPGKLAVKKDGEWVKSNIATFIDSGCSTMGMIQQDLVETRGIQLHALSQPKNVFGYNGKLAERIEWYVMVELGFGGVYRPIKLLVSQKLPVDIILGAPWLRRYNPRIDWRDLSVEFTVKDEPVGWDEVNHPFKGERPIEGKRCNLLKPEDIVELEDFEEESVDTRVSYLYTEAGDSTTDLVEEYHHTGITIV